MSRHRPRIRRENAMLAVEFTNIEALSHSVSHKIQFKSLYKPLEGAYFDPSAITSTNLGEVNVAITQNKIFQLLSLAVLEQFCIYKDYVLWSKIF